MRRPGPMASNTIAVLGVAAGVAAAFGLYLGLFGTPTTDVVNRLTARSSGFLLGVLGAGTMTSGTVVVSQRFAFQVVEECTVIGPLLVYAAAVLAFPAGLRGKGWGLAVGVAGLSGLNALRLVTLYFIGAYAPRYLDVAHLVIWQGVMVLTTVLLWLWWVQRWGRGARA